MATENLSPDTDTQYPEDWRKIPLGSIADVRFSNVDKLTIPSEEPVRLCNYIDVYKNDYITGDLEFMRASATQAEISRFGLQVGDVIMTKDSETPDDIGVSTVVDYAAQDLVCGYHLGLIRPKKDEVDPTFLSKQLGHHRIASYLGRQANGLTRYGLPLGAVINAPIWLPDLKEQKAIGSLLRLIDEAIARTEAVIVKLKQVRAGLLHDLLTRGLDEHGQLRDPIAHPEQFKDSPIGKIPSGWRVSILGAELPLQRGFDITVAEQRQGEVPVVSSSGITSYHNEAMVSGPGVVTGRKGKLGDVYYIDRPFWPHDTTLWVTDFRGNSEKFAALLLNQMRLERFDAATSVPTLNRNFVHPLPVALPSRTEQERLVAVVEAWDGCLYRESKWLAKLRNLHVGLSADLLAGRVRVPENLDLAEVRG